jgi:Major intrinsic protein
MVALSANLVRNSLTEFIGTFFLVAVGTGVVIETALGRPIAGEPAGSLGIALAFGLVLVVLVNVSVMYPEHTSTRPSRCRLQLPVSSPGELSPFISWPSWLGRSVPR